MKKVIKTGIKKAILFYFDEDNQMARMVMFGELDKLMPFYFKMIDAGFRRPQDMIKIGGGKEKMTRDEMMRIIRDTRPSGIDDNYSDAFEGAKMNLTYEIKKIKC